MVSAGDKVVASVAVASVSVSASAVSTAVDTDARAAVVGPVWTFLQGILPSGGTAVTSLYFTTWPQIWTEFTPFCGGQLLQGQTAWTACNTPNAQHFLIPETADDFYNITRFLSRQFILASHTDSRTYPWFVEGLSSGWRAGRCRAAARSRSRW